MPPRTAPSLRQRPPGPRPSRACRRAGLAAALAVGLTLASAASAPLSASPPTHPTPEQLRAEFGALCEQMRQGDDVIFGEAILGELEARLQRPLPPAVAMATHGRLGIELRRLGRNAEALAQLALARRLATEHQLGEEADLQLARDLALTHLRAGETANCVARHTAASCILPIAPAGVHADPVPARQAASLYAEVLRRRPEDVRSRWLLNLAAMVAGDHHGLVPEHLRLPPEALQSDQPFPAWRDVAPQLGVAAFDLAGGAIVDDFDGDGLLDLVSSTNDPCGPLQAFRNRGDGTFEDVAERWGLDVQLGGLNLIHADFDGDGHLDLLVLRGGWWGERGRLRNSLLRNDLHGPTRRFVDVTAAAGIAWPAYPTQTAAFADYDGDGHLDLYVGNEASADHPYPSQLFRNRGDGTFEDVTARAGVANVRYAKGVAWGDLDDDGRPDLYVSNLGPNRLYRNAGDGTFIDVAAAAGVTAPEGQSFATWFFDFDNDGDLDLFVADYGAPIADVAASTLGVAVTGGHPLLYRNDGDGTFTDVSREVGLTRPLLPMGANHADVDNDGWLDVYLGTGSPEYEALMPGILLRNDAGTFRDVTFAAGLGHLQKGHGVAFGDVDHDGDPDLLHQLGGQLPGDGYGNALFENPGSPHHWLKLRLEGRGGNRWAIGARVEVLVREGDGRRSLHRLVGSGGSFGGSTLRQEIGLGAADGIESIVVRWPGAAGAVQRYPGVPLDAAYRLIEGDAVPQPLPLHRFELGGTTPPHQHSPARGHHP